jgi:phosphoesterase RecJ-like protein
MIDQIAHQLKESRRLLLTSHTNPDGDAVSSMLALGLALKKIGKDIVWLNESPIPTVYRFLPSVDQIAQSVETNRPFDATVVLDCGNTDRAGCTPVVIERAALVVNIDHHATNTGFGHLQYVDPTACATAELIYRLLDKMEIAFDQDIATAIYTGILTDTGSFRFSNTNSAAFAICTEMTTLGVDPYDIAQHVYGPYPLERIKLLNLALDSIEISANRKVSVMTVTQAMLNQTGTQQEDVDGLIHYARRIQNVKVAALIQELHNGNEHAGSPGKYHVSLRSDGAVDVAALATAYGGGGHRTAAGFGMEATLSEVRLEIATLAEKL